MICPAQCVRPCVCISYSLLSVSDVLFCSCETSYDADCPPMPSAALESRGYCGSLRRLLLQCMYCFCVCSLPDQKVRRSESRGAPAPDPSPCHLPLVCCLRVCACASLFCIWLPSRVSRYRAVHPLPPPQKSFASSWRPFLPLSVDVFGISERNFPASRLIPRRFRVSHFHRRCDLRTGSCAEMLTFNLLCGTWTAPSGM